MNTQLLNYRNIIVNAQNIYYFVEKQVFIYIYIWNIQKNEKQIV